MRKKIGVLDLLKVKLPDFTAETTRLSNAAKTMSEHDFMHELAGALENVYIKSRYDANKESRHDK